MKTFLFPDRPADNYRLLAE